MAIQVQDNTNLPRFQPHFAALQHRPMLLKDFLRDDASPHPCTTQSLSSSTSPLKKSTAVLSKSNKSSSSHIVLLRSWSERAAATRISAVHKVIKLLQLASSKSPSVLPRSISRRLTKRLTKGDDDDIIFRDTAEIKVKVKDILRWRSFRDLVEDDVPTPLGFAPSPYRSTTAATTTTITTSCSKRSSWCDSDFTAEELPPWGGENEEFWGKNAASLKNPKGDWSSFEEEYEQQSPVSVLDSPFRQVQDFTHFHPLLSKIDQRARCGLTRRTDQEVNVAEEKAKHLLSQIKENVNEFHDDRVMLDFFIDELSMNGNLNDDEFDCNILRIAKSWMDGGEFEESYEWDVEEERESFVKDMEKGICWNKFKQEQRELCEDLEARVLDHLIDDLVVDFLVR